MVTNEKVALGIQVAEQTTGKIADALDFQASALRNLGIETELIDYIQHLVESLKGTLHRTTGRLESLDKAQREEFKRSEPEDLPF